MDLQAFLRLLKGVKPGSHGEHVAKCPAHDDKTASLCVAAGEKGIVDMLMVILGILAVSLMLAWAHSRYVKGYAAGCEGKEQEYLSKCTGCRYLQRSSRLNTMSMIDRYLSQQPSSDENPYFVKAFPFDDTDFTLAVKPDWVDPLVYARKPYKILDTERLYANDELADTRITEFAPAIDREYEATKEGGNNDGDQSH